MVPKHPSKIVIFSISQIYPSLLNKSSGWKQLCLWYLYCLSSISAPPSVFYGAFCSFQVFAGSIRYQPVARDSRDLWSLTGWAPAKPGYEARYTQQSNILAIPAEI